MKEKYNFPLEVRILDRDYKHALTWQQNDAKTGFEIVTVDPPVHVPDPNLTPILPDSALAQSPEGTSGRRRWRWSWWR